MKLSKDDYRIFLAALQVAIEDDRDTWDELTGDEFDRAEEIRDLLLLEIEEPEEDDADDDPWEEDAEEGEEEEDTPKSRKKRKGG